MADYTSHNLQVLQKFFRQGKGDVRNDRLAMEILSRVADSILDWVKDKTYTYEDDTYNLTDSIGCAIYKNGVLVKTLVNPKQAQKTRTITYKKARYTINGRSLLTKALNDGEIASMGQYVLGVFVATPYGKWVDLSLGDGGGNKRGKGWFSGPNGLKEFAGQEFIRIKNEYINRK